MWDTRAEGTKPSFSVEGHTAEVNAISFNPFNDLLLATGSADRTVALWDIRQNDKAVHVLDKHADEVYYFEWGFVVRYILKILN